MARTLGVSVLGTTRSAEKLALLADLGALPLLDDHTLAQQICARVPEGVDAVLDIVGTSSLLESLRWVRYGGRVAMAGFLGGASPLSAFDPLQHLPSGVQLSFFASAFMFGSDACPLSGIPFQSIVDGAAARRYAAAPAHVFAFDEIVAAHRLMESGTARGKIVVLGRAS
jgi:NADPH:quinone reductase-like Zn-dependent oxidoreductase